MSSPQSMGSQEPEEGSRGKKTLEQITFRFCSECSNLLYPKEDPDAQKLQYTCRNCQNTEEATSSCVYRDILNNQAGETAGVTQDVGSDPTVGSPSTSCDSDFHGVLVFCMHCGCMIQCTSCDSPFQPPSLVETSHQGIDLARGQPEFSLDIDPDSSDAESWITMSPPSEPTVTVQSQQSGFDKLLANSGYSSSFAFWTGVDLSELADEDTDEELFDNMGNLLV